jgi:alpha-tubulin suppressor-like RCC1 family protein
MGAPRRYTILLAAACLAAWAAGSHAAAPGVAGGDRHSLALHADGTMSAWGTDVGGELGSRPVYSSTPRAIVGVDQATQVKGGRFHSLARRADGTVVGWGYNATGAIGDGTFTTRSSAATVLIDQVTQVAPSGHFSLARRADATVWSWGENTSGQLGVPNAGFRSTPAAVPGLANVSSVAAGFAHALALLADGTVWSWGANGSGQLGTGPGPDRPAPAQVPGLTGVLAISGGVLGQVSAALRNDGTVWTWGSLGGASPVQAPGLTNVVAIAAGRTHVIALRGDGSVWAWGANNVGQLGDGTFTFRPNPQAIPGLGGVVAIAAGSTHNLALLGDGTVRAWGSNAFGEVGDGTLVNRNMPTPVPALGAVAAVSAGDGHSIVLRPDGSAIAWGSNLAGQLGDGSPVNRTVPAPATVLTNVVEAAAGSSHNVALRGDGTVWTWGGGISGELGDGTFVSRAHAAQVSTLPAIAEVTAGSIHSLARTAAGAVYAWGLNDRGQLGDNTLLTRNAPVPVDGVLAKALGAGHRHSIVVATDKTVWAWGLNDHGQLGDGTLDDRHVPTQVPGLTNFLAVAGGTFHTLALNEDGTVWAWGANGAGELGDGTLTQRTSPVPVQGLANVVAIAAGQHRSMALTADGAVWAWGERPLGDGTNTNASTPRQVPGISGAAAIAMGLFHWIVMLDDGSLLTWGDNSFGAVGDGTYVVRPTPVVPMADDGAGSLDGNDWYLDLKPAVATSIPAARTPATLAVAQAKGEDDRLDLKATVKHKAADAGKALNTYVLGIVPAEFFGLVKKAPGTPSVRELKARAKAALILAQLTPQGWSDVNGQLIAYAQGVGNAAGGAASILDGINTTLIPGARFCIGYGETADAMLSASGLREVLSLEGASAASSGVPCVLSGVYVSGPAGSTSGSPVTFTATVVGLSPTGVVSFRDGFATVAAGVPISPTNPAVAKASTTTSSLIVGMHSISATYSGDAQNGAASTAIPVLHEVRSAQGGVRVDLAGPASSTAGTEAVFVATVIGNQATGTVQFLDSGSPLATVPLVDATATLRIAALGIGNHSIAASYSGDAGNTPGISSPIAHLVAAVPIATKVTLAASTASPKIGTLVTFTATVAGSAPTGSVRFRDYGSDFSGPVALAGGQAQFTLSSLAAGSHAVTAQYSGDGSNPPVTSSTQVVNVVLELDPAQASADTDGDGIPNGVELAENTNPSIRDNDVFASARLFSMQQYRDFLAREGDAGGIAFWVSQVSGGAMSRGQVIESFFGSPEFQGTIAPVARLYFAYFLRIPDYAGIDFWIGYYRAGNPMQAISDFFAQSGEFQALYGALDNGAFVDLVYQNVLGRAPDPDGLAFWKGQLDAGQMTRGQVMLGFSESEEYRNAIFSSVYVTMAYIGMLRRAPEQGGFDFWVGYMNAGNPGLALLDLFLAAPEYRERFLN